jgi:GNAT superfamily N-acetyltransferase
LIQVASPADLEQVRTLFREYQAGLGIDLCFQDFETELAELPGVYSQPDGNLWIHPGGVVAVKPLPNTEIRTCEMKRLYVRPEFRGTGLGRELAKTTIDWARTAGYARMKLDTLARLENAVQLYRSLGFIETASYNYNPENDVLYFQLDL